MDEMKPADGEPIKEDTKGGTGKTALLVAAFFGGAVLTGSVEELRLNQAVDLGKAAAFTGQAVVALSDISVSQHKAGVIVGDSVDNAPTVTFVDRACTDKGQTILQKQQPEWKLDHEFANGHALRLIALDVNTEDNSAVPIAQCQYPFSDAAPGRVNKVANVYFSPTDELIPPPMPVEHIDTSFHAPLIGQ